ncbi:MAG: glycerophosphodiester phosphodiesterase [Acidimicrobiia bacterium]|nr:glycerophosphodiester phosphodiesterase [Acidimicrobiia bacterium]
MVARVIAHRTCPRHAIENSLAGILAAGALGAGYVEVDVRRTRDGVPVLMHDRTPGRTARFVGAARPLGRMPLRCLASATLAGTRLRGDAPGAGDPVPTLAAALGAAPPPLGFALDVKDPGAGPATLRAVREAQMDDRVLLWSQHEAAVRHFAGEAEGIEVSLLRDTASPAATRRLLDDAVAWGARGVSVHQGVLDEALVAEAHGRGLAVYCWFQSLAVQEEMLARASGFGLDGVVTDWVAGALATVG